MRKTKKTLFIAHYFTSEDRIEKDWMIFIAPENCDRVKEFKHVYKCEMGEAFPKYMELDGIYDIPSAFDYRDKGLGDYEIKLMKDSPVAQKKYKYIKLLVVNKEQGWFTLKYGADVKQFPITFLPVVKTLLNKIYALQNRKN